MRNHHLERPPQNRVMAEFEGSALSFALPRDATFEDLATRLAVLGRPHHGAPISVVVRVGS